MNSLLNIKIGKYLAVISFVIGTIIFTTHLILSKEDYQDDLVWFGLGYLVVAFAINLLFLIILIVNIFVDEENTMGIIKTIGLMLLNIPIAFLYFYFTLDKIL